MNLNLNGYIKDINNEIIYQAFIKNKIQDTPTTIEGIFESDE